MSADASDERNDPNVSDKEKKTSSERKSSSDRRPSFFRRRSRSKSIDEGGIRTISDIIGNWGTYQSRLFALYVAIYVMAPIQNQGVIFYTDKVDHWCKLPEGVDKVSSEFVINPLKCFPVICERIAMYKIWNRRKVHVMGI